MKSIIPDFTRSEAISKRNRLTPKCPFAHCRLCPKYYESCWLLSQEGLAAKIDSEKELDELWEKSKLTPCKKEESPAIINVNGKVIVYRNFCPVVLLDRFGYSASRLAEYTDENEKEIAHRRLKEENVPLRDPQWRWSGITPMHFSECGYYSILKGRNGRGK
jgi:hypothetical protein